MDLEPYDTCIVFNDDWKDLKNYFFIGEIDDGEITLREVSGELKRKVSKNERLVRHPSDRRLKESNPLAYRGYRFVLDVASSLISQYGSMHLDALVERIHEDTRIYIEKHIIEYFLKGLVASGNFEVLKDSNTKTQAITLTLGEDRREFEKKRRFAGSMAGELDALSQRIRLIISHPGTVGTYREGLLQKVLQKHLPERYHVATGFIYGCPRQIDILIYDRIEYAPLFREGDLVVIPASAARAVIEVKTNLTTTQLKNSLSLLSDVGALDDGFPPMFKGIFAFESDVSKSTLCDQIKLHYLYDDFDIGEDQEIPRIISRPFEHLTCACVIDKNFVFTMYNKTKNGKYIPSLFSSESNTGLSNQVALFMEQLLSYLRFGGAKGNNFHSFEEMLGSDTLLEHYADLAVEDWGVYFAAKHGVSKEPEREVEDMENMVANVQAWLLGEQRSWLSKND
ncbi:hypothetical protein KRR23_14550 [Pseudomonas sp. CVAP|uniref:DUF6602 domain-containing protein n=1 Tax=Pseudomonas sp. CVAP\|nr:DUF6602 domain-containing protein [Pseudomonas sp. CVAP\